MVADGAVAAEGYGGPGQSVTGLMAAATSCSRCRHGVERLTWPETLSTELCMFSRHMSSASGSVKSAASEGKSWARLAAWSAGASVDKALR